MDNFIRIVKDFLVERRKSSRNLYRPGVVLKDLGFLTLIYGSLQRLQFFLPHLPNVNVNIINYKLRDMHLLEKQSHVTALHLIVADGYEDVAQCLLNKLNDNNPTATSLLAKHAEHMAKSDSMVLLLRKYMHK